jgi:hypothetical protein
MQVKRFRRGVYIVTLHGHSFTIEGCADSKSWAIFNATGTEVNRWTTKRSLLDVMARWSPDYTATQAEQEFCTYA